MTCITHKALEIAKSNPECISLRNRGAMLQGFTLDDFDSLPNPLGAKFGCNVGGGSFMVLPSQLGQFTTVTTDKYTFYFEF